MEEMSPFSQIYLVWINLVIITKKAMLQLQQGSVSKLQY